MTKLPTTVLIILLCVVNRVLTGEVDYTDCGSIYGFSKVNIDGCEGQTCRIPAGKNVTISFDVSTDEKGEFLKNEATISMLGIIFDVHIFPDSPCDFWDCPFTNIHNTYKANFVVDSFNTNIEIPMYFNFKLTDDLSNSGVCFFLVATLLD